MDVAGKSDVDACEVLAQHFHDARESASGVLVLDELEEILRFSREAQGHSHNSAARQLIKAELRTEAMDGKRLLVLATTGDQAAMEQMELLPAFDFVAPVPLLTEAEAVDFLAYLQPPDSAVADEAVREWYAAGKRLGMKHIRTAMESAKLTSKHAAPWTFQGALAALAAGGGSWASPQ